ncbi:MAG: hypothetical protein AB1758_21205 [Candidatus Eremiobacterota bacterium]
MRWWLAALAWVALAGSVRAEAPLEFRISLGATSYRQGQAIPCQMELRNVSPRPLRVNGRLLVNWPNPSPHEVFFEVTGPRGYLLPFQLLVRAGDPLDEDYLLLEPGESTRYECDLAECFRIQSPGLYRLQAVYENVSGGEEVWSGRLRSNPLEFTLVE